MVAFSFRLCYTDRIVCALVARLHSVGSGSNGVSIGYIKRINTYRIEDNRKNMAELTRKNVIFLKSWIKKIYSI